MVGDQEKWRASRTLTHSGRQHGRGSLPGGPSVHRKCVHSAHVHENGFSRPPGDFTYTPPFSRPYRGFHDFHVFSRTFMVFSRPFAHIFTYVLWFSRPSPVFTPTPCFHVHTVIFEFIWPNGHWTHFSCPNGPPGMDAQCWQDGGGPIIMSTPILSPGARMKSMRSTPGRKDGLRWTLGELFGKLCWTLKSLGRASCRGLIRMTGVR